MPHPPTSTSPPQQYPRVTSVVNLKGGVGKTTLCVNLAYGLAYFKDKRTLLIDLDPQANATQYLISQHTYQKLYLSEPPPKSTIVEA
nr:ParA family protein [Corallococcus sp. BB11-1]